MTILLTGFGPFPGVRDNPTQTIAQGLNGVQIGDKRIQSLLLPVSIDNANRHIITHCHDKIRAIVNLGVSTRIDAIHIETRAKNLFSSSCGDIHGRGQGTWNIDPNGDIFRYTALPCAQIQESLRQADIAAEISNNAGAYVCNWLYYLRLGDKIPALFIHVPQVSEKWPLDRLHHAVNISLQNVDDALSMQ